MDGEFLRRKYKKLYDIIVEAQVREKALAKQARSLANDILSEKITLEKVRLDEMEELNGQKKLEEIRDAAEKVKY